MTSVYSVTTVLSDNNTYKTFLFALLRNVRENCINKDYKINKERKPLEKENAWNQKVRKRRK